MLNKSRRAKSSRLQNLVRDKILKAFKPHLRKQDVQTAPNGVNGPDIILSRIAKKLCPKLEPVVVMKMNTRKPLAVIDLDTFVDLIR